LLAEAPETALAFHGTLTPGCGSPPLGGRL
jgi:hypothetical protein